MGRSVNTCTYLCELFAKYFNLFTPDCTLQPALLDFMRHLTMSSRQGGHGQLATNLIAWPLARRSGCQWPSFSNLKSLPTCSKTTAPTLRSHALDQLVILFMKLSLFLFLFMLRRSPYTNCIKDSKHNFTFHCSA